MEVASATTDVTKTTAATVRAAFSFTGCGNPRSPCPIGSNCGIQRPGADRVAGPPNRPLATATDLVHGVVPPALRRQLRRPLPRLRLSDGDAERPERDPGAVHGSQARASARPLDRADAGHGPALGAAARGFGAPGEAARDAAAVPRRAHA